MPEPESDLKAQMRKNLETMKSMGFDPYQNYSFERTHTSAGLRKEFADIGQDKSGKVVSAAGRVMAKRIHGKAGFADLVDRDGKVQLY
ncbi:MAG: lysine--tRNA ligase, partial [Thermoplasmata archaeon]|nr:lysine--tRNA ligase [Thermoplasmata archaeon]